MNQTFTSLSASNYNICVSGQILFLGIVVLAILIATLSGVLIQTTVIWMIIRKVFISRVSVMRLSTNLLLFIPDDYYYHTWDGNVSHLQQKL